jgi:hypothetical protein
MRTVSTAIVVWIAVLASVSARADEDVTGLFSITPAGSANYMAAQLELPQGQALAGLGWYHNDATAAFPEVILMEGTAQAPPDLANTALVLEHLQGPSLSWGTATLSAPVTSSTGIVYAVFRLPAEEMTATGDGGGPGIGIRQDPGSPPSYLSADGQTWLKLGDDYTMAVTATLVQAKGPVPTLASLVGNRDHEQTAKVVSYRTELLPPVPNPFNPTTQIRFTLAAATEVELVVYNVRGQRVRTLLRERREAGAHEVTWLGKDDHGSPVSSGVYYVRMVTAKEEFVRRVALLR